MVVLDIRSSLLLARENFATMDPNATRLPVFIATTSPFAAVALLFYSARMYSRMVPTLHLYWDDYIITLGVLFSFLTWIFALCLEIETGARHIEFVPLLSIEKGLQYTFFLYIISYYANLLIKASVCVMLLRIMQARSWKIGLWIMIGTLAIVAVTTTITTVLECKPIPAFWHIEQHFQDCWSQVIVTDLAQLFGAYFVLTDLILALLPIVFIRQLQRPTRERALLAILMGCGMIATAAGIAKMVYYHRVANTTDIFYQGVYVGVFTMIELFLGISGCCAPCLKSLVERALLRLGIDLATLSKVQYGSSRYPDSLGYPVSSQHHTSRSVGASVEVSRMSRAEAQAWERQQGPNNINTDISGAGGYSSAAKDVIVKESFVTWEST